MATRGEIQALPGGILDDAVQKFQVYLFGGNPACRGGNHYGEGPRNSEEVEEGKGGAKGGIEGIQGEGQSRWITSWGGTRVSQRGNGESRAKYMRVEWHR